MVFLYSPGSDYVANYANTNVLSLGKRSPKIAIFGDINGYIGIATFSPYNRRGSQSSYF